MTGIYKITHRDSGTVYIGQAVNIKRRWRTHREELRINRHRNQRLQRAWIRDGESAFEFVVIEECAKDALTIREQFWLDSYRAIGEVYNFGSCAYPVMRGVELTIEHREKLSRSHIGHPVSPETRAKIGAARRGKPLLLEHRKKLSDAHRGVPLSDKHRSSISKALTGLCKSPEHTAKAGAARHEAAICRKQMC